MSRKNFSKFILLLCLCGVGELGVVPTWADPVTAAARTSPAVAPTNSDQASLGTGLKLSPDLMEPHPQVAAPPVMPVEPPATLLMTDKSLVSAAHAADDRPRLGQKLDAGIASWYGPRFQGRRTASGEKFDRFALTAAHKTLPLGTRVLVSNPRTGKQIVVRINDRGPYVGNRMLDLSEAAASALGLKNRGHDWVVMNKVLPPENTPASDMAGDAAHRVAEPADAPGLPSATDLARGGQAGKPLLKPAPAASVSGAAADPVGQLAMEE